MRHPLRAVIVVVALLHLLAIGHGLPHRYVPDDSVVKCVLGVARDLGGAGGDGDATGAADVSAVSAGPSAGTSRLAALVPPAGRYTTYPYGLVWGGLGAVGARYVLGRVTGEWGGAGEFADLVFDDATLAWLPVRLLVALLALLLPQATYRAARELGRGKAEAALAALLAGSSLLVVQYAHTTRPWAPLVACGAATLALSLRLRRRSGPGPVLAACVAAGLTASVHQVGLAALGLPLLASVLWRTRVVVAGAGLATGLAVALVVGYPFLAVHGAGSGAGSIAGSDAAALQVGGQAFDAAAFGGRHAWATAGAWLGYDPVLLVAGLLGALTMRRRTDLRAWWLVVVPTAVLGALFLLYDGTHVRYLMPTVPFLALGAADALRRLAAAGRAGRALALVLVAVPLVQAARLDWLLGRTDTRTLAAARVPALVAPGELLAVDGFGSYYGPPLQATAASLRAVAALVPLNRSEARHVARTAAGVPEPSGAVAVLPIERFYRFDSYYPTDWLGPDAPVTLGEAFARFGVDAYVQVDRLPDERRRQPVTELMAARGRLVLDLSPTGATAPAAAQLPTDLSFALTQLWAYERPGPWIRVWRLSPPAGEARR